MQPIIDNADDKEKLIENNALYLFNSRPWEHAKFHIVQLETIHRQADDRLFQKILHQIRIGETEIPNIMLPDTTTSVNCIDALNKLCYRGIMAKNSSNAIAICTTKKEAEKVNLARAAALKSDVEIFKAQIIGKFNMKDLPTDEHLSLQIGARVMTLCNKKNADGSFEYVNGDLGEVIEFIHDNNGIGKVVVQFDDGRRSVIEQMKWSTYKHVHEIDRNTGKTIIKIIEEGSFTQIPLRLAWAITIHKAQGMGFDQITLRTGNGCFAEGQFYTAISRCRSLQGLLLHKKVFTADVTYDEKVLDFYNQPKSCTEIQCA